MKPKTILFQVSAAINGFSFKHSDFWDSQISGFSFGSHLRCAGEGGGGQAGGTWLLLH
jgi:hypothetical protein